MQRRGRIVDGEPADRRRATDTRLPRWQALSLAGGGLGFVSAMAIGIAPKITFAAGVVAWAAALFPLGREALRHRGGDTA